MSFAYESVNKYCELIFVADNDLWNHRVVYVEWRTGILKITLAHLVAFDSYKRGIVYVGRTVAASVDFSMEMPVGSFGIALQRCGKEFQ